MDPKDLQNLVNLADKLDQDGHSTEAAALDTVLQKYASDEEGKMSNKAHNAMKSLQRALVSFCGKNLDARGPKRRNMNKICDMAEDLLSELKGMVGEGD